MPDEKGKLSNQEVEAAKKWLGQHWTKNAECPICGSNSYNISDKAVYPVTYTGKASLLGGPVYPQILVTCMVCGYVVHFNAVIMGVLAKAEGAELKDSEEIGAAKPAQGASDATAAD